MAVIRVDGRILGRLGRGCHGMVVVFVKGCAPDEMSLRRFGVEAGGETRLRLGAKMVRGHEWACACEVRNYRILEMLFTPWQTIDGAS